MPAPPPTAGDAARRSPRTAANALPPEHPDKVALQRATAKLYKTVKKQRRDEAKSAIQEADRAVIESTATGAPTRRSTTPPAAPGITALPARRM